MWESTNKYLKVKHLFRSRVSRTFFILRERKLRPRKSALALTSLSNVYGAPEVERKKKREEKRFDGRFISYDVSQNVSLCTLARFYYFPQISISRSRDADLSNLFTFMSVIFIAQHLSAKIHPFPFTCNSAFNTFSTT